MPLFTCPDCGKEVSDRAKFCPHCGRPVGVLDVFKSSVQRAQKNARNQVPPCPHCGRQLSFKEALKLGPCPYCGVPITREEIRSSMQGKQSTGKQVRPKAVLVGAALFIGLLIFVNALSGMLGEKWALDRERAKQTANAKKDATANERTEKVLSFTTPAGTLERTVEEIALEVLGERVNWEGKKPTIIKIENKGQYFELKYRAKDSLSKNLIRQGILLDAMKIYEKVFSDLGCSTIMHLCLEPQFMFTDIYGKSLEKRIALMDLRREAARKIKWQNMTTDSFFRLLNSSGDIWLHHELN